MLLPREQLEYESQSGSPRVRTLSAHAPGKKTVVLQGSLETLSLTSVFQFVAGPGSTGSVWLSDGMREDFIYFENGDIRMIATGREENYHLDAYLIKNTLASPQDVKAVTAESKAAGKRLENALLEAGLATQEDLAAAIIIWMEERLFRLSELREGRFKFMVDYRPHGKTDPLQESCNVLISVNNLLLTLAGRQEDWRAMMERFPDENAIFEATRINPDEISSYPVPAGWFEEIGLLDGTRSIAEILSETFLTRFEFYQFLSELRYRGLLVMADKEKLIELAEQARKDGDVAAVIKFFENALAWDSGDIETRINYAEILQNMDLTQEAFEKFRTVGDLLYKEGNFEEAMQHYRTALVLKDDSPEVIFNIADIHEISGNMEKALELRGSVAHLYVKAGRYRDSADIFGYLAEKQPEEIGWYLLAADSFGELDMPDDATEFYEKAIATAIKTGRKDEVQRIINVAMNRFPRNTTMERRLLQSVRKYSQSFKRQDEKDEE